MNSKAMQNIYREMIIGVLETTKDICDKEVESGKDTSAVALQTAKVMDHLIMIAKDGLTRTDGKEGMNFVNMLSKIILELAAMVIIHHDSREVYDKVSEVLNEFSAQEASETIDRLKEQQKAMADKGGKTVN